MEQMTRLSVVDGSDGAVGRTSSEAGIEILRMFERFVLALEQIRNEQKRIADHFDSPPRDVVGTEYIAEELDCTKVWVSQMARDGEIPRECIVPGTGNGKPWKFRRSSIDRWLSAR